MTPEQLSSKIRTIPDFPKKGIVFRDITTLLQDGEAFAAALEAMTAPIRGLKPDVIIGIESRGFIFGAPIAATLGVGFVPVRKLGKLPADAPRNRLGLAKWIISDANPLTTRVTVNRMWQELFGTGLVKTSEDFGIMGSLPSHPELLDWLAIDFRTHGWDVKRFYKQLLTSATYRQAALTTKEKVEKDRDNALLSRGPRFRMDAEMLRDQALAVSGTLSPRMGGPGTKPYQPENIWEVVGVGIQAYRPDKGENLYRRSLYNYWRRMAPPASLDLFNAPSREVSCVRRDRTNTPLQALTLQNDATYLESSQAIAAELLREGGDATRIQSLFRRVLSREANDQEAALLGRTLMKARAHYRAQPAAAAQFLRVGQRVHADGADLSELAAWTVVASLTLNLDEAITHE